METINPVHKKQEKTSYCLIIYRSKKNLKKDRWVHCRTFHDFAEVSRYFKQIENSELTEKYKYLVSRRMETAVIETLNPKELLLQRIKHGF